MCKFSHDAHNGNNRKMADGFAMRERERENEIWGVGMEGERGTWDFIILLRLFGAFFFFFRVQTELVPAHIWKSLD